MIKKFLLTALVACTYYVSFSQDTPPPTTVYPKVVGYASFIHPLVTFDKDQHVYNFDGAYTVGFPMGINILKSDRIGFSFEVTPFIRVQNDTAKVTTVMFHPGVIFRFRHDMAFTTRLAFETSGRFGFTPVFSKVLIKTKGVNYFTAVGTPIRTGNGKPATIGVALQFGIVF